MINTYNIHQTIDYESSPLVIPIKKLKYCKCISKLDMPYRCQFMYRGCPTISYHGVSVIITDLNRVSLPVIIQVLVNSWQFTGFIQVLTHVSLPTIIQVFTHVNVPVIYKFLPMIVYRLLNNYLLMSVYAGHHASSYPSQCTDSYSITHVHNSTGSSLSPGGGGEATI